MNKWKEDIDKVKEHLLKLKDELKPYLDKANLKEKESQLKSVESTIVQLDKNQISIPDELRELKFRLLKELDEFVEAEMVIEEIHGLFVDFSPKGELINKQQTNKKRIHNRRIYLKDLIDANIFTPPLNIYKRYKGEDFHAVINDEGLIEISKDEEKHVFDTPTAATKFATNLNLNGWTWWNIEGYSKHENLFHFRQKYEKL